MHTTSQCVISAAMPSLSLFTCHFEKPKGVKCFVNELNELYQLSNVCVSVEHVPLIVLLSIAVY